MSGGRSGDSAEFTVRCSCGESYNSNDGHVGKQLKCRCGRMVTIARPTVAAPTADGRRSKESKTPLSETLFSSASPGTRTRSSSSERASSRTTKRSAPNTGVAAVAAAIGGWTSRGSDALRCWLRNEAQSFRSPHASRRWAARLSWGWFAACVGAWLLLVRTSESFLPATILAYGPRWVTLLPLALLVPVCVIGSRRALVPLALSAMVALCPIMGGRLSFRSLGRGYPSQPAKNDVRIMTLNAEGGIIVARRIRSLLSDVRPDIITLQECGDVLWDSLQAIAELHLAREGSLCTASRWVLEPAEAMPNGDLHRLREQGYGGAGLAIRQFVQSPHRRFALVNLHLETARKGLELLPSPGGFIGGRTSGGKPIADDVRGTPLQVIAVISRIREIESERASVWAQQGDRTVPLIVAGDFNLPIESAIFRRHWNSFSDAFELAGTGFGWSKREGRWLRIRIDHVLSNDYAPKAIGTWLGADVGSDHLPVITDLRW